jgi:hypothetical protein
MLYLINVFQYLNTCDISCLFRLSSCAFSLPSLRLSLQVVPLRLVVILGAFTWAFSNISLSPAYYGDHAGEVTNRCSF